MSQKKLRIEAVEAQKQLFESLNKLHECAQAEAEEEDDEEYIVPGDEEFMKILRHKREENDKHFFQMGFKYSHAMFRMIVKRLEDDPTRCVDTIAAYLAHFHDMHFEDDTYRDGIVTMEEDADQVISGEYREWEEE